MKQNVFTIFQGDDKVLSMKALYEENLTPLDLTDCDEIDVSLPNSDGTFTHLLLSEDDVAITSPALLGAFTATIASDVSELLNVGELQSFDVTFTITTKKTTIKFVQALSVFQRD